MIRVSASGTQGLSAQKQMNSLPVKEALDSTKSLELSAVSSSSVTPTSKSITTETLSGMPPTLMPNEQLSGVPNSSPVASTTNDPLANTLPDLLVNQEQLDSTVTTEEDLVAADTLLSLIDPRDDRHNEDELDNSKLMPVSGNSNIVHAAPVPLVLDQVNVDSAIANIMAAEGIQNATETMNSMTVHTSIKNR